MRPAATFLVMALVAGASIAWGQGKAKTPAPGSPERKALMDVLRSSVKKSLAGKPVIFKVQHLKMLDGWAFLFGEPLQPNGKPFDYHGTIYQRDIDDGAFDSNVYALFRKSGKKWVVKGWTIGATDVGWDGWWDKFKAPRSIFP